MSDPVTMYVRGTPAPKGSFRVITRARGGAPLAAPRVLKDSPRTDAWHALVKDAAVAAMADMRRQVFAGIPLFANITFFLVRPNGHYGKRGLRPTAPRYPAVKPDLDKLVRATLDPLEGVVFDGDSRIVRLIADKVYAEQTALIGIGTEPGALIVIGGRE